MSAPTCVRCDTPRDEHGDVDPREVPEGICPRFEAPAPRWLTVVSRAVEKLTERPE